MSRFWHYRDPEIQQKKIPKPAENQHHEHLLPNELGCRIIEMEMQTFDTEMVSKQAILALLNQYSKAVEFFEERGSDKYLLYQKKIQHFLMRPAISQILNGKQGSMLMKKEQNEEELKKMQLHSHAAVKKIIEDSQNSGKKQQEIIHNQIQNQQKQLQERIQRKRANSQRNSRPKVTTASFSIPTSKISTQKDQFQGMVFVQVPSPIKPHILKKNQGQNLG